MVNTMAESSHSKNVRKKPSPQGESVKKTRSYFEDVISGERLKRNLGIGKYSRRAKMKAKKDAEDTARSDRMLKEKAKEERARKRKQATKRNQEQIAKKASAPAAKKYNVGVSKGGVSFKEAFAHFRKKGQKTFTWNGKKYTTEVAKKDKK